MTPQKRPIPKPGPKSVQRPKRALRLAVPEPEAEIEEPKQSSRRIWYIVLLAVGLVLLGGSAYYALTGLMTGFEERIFEAVNNVSLPSWITEQVAKPLSNAVWGMGGLVVLLLALPKYRFRAWQYLVAGASAYVLTFIVEHLVDRARPIDLTVNILLRASQGGPGFPSGHVAVLTALGATIWPLVSWPWRLLIVVLVVAEAWSRVFLGVHAPLDVVGGIGVGFITVAIIHLLPKKLVNFFKVAS